MCPQRSILNYSHFVHTVQTRRLRQFPMRDVRRPVLTVSGCSPDSPLPQALLPADLDETAKARAQGFGQTLLGVDQRPVAGCRKRNARSRGL
jgi:hypothetical protein